jgi:hypothetical protein
MAAVEVAAEPAVRRRVRDEFMARGVLNTSPTVSAAWAARLQAEAWPAAGRWLRARGRRLAPAPAAHLPRTCRLTPPDPAA